MAWNLAEVVYDGLNVSVNAQEANPYCAFFKPDGTKMFVVGFTNDTVFQYTLSTAWDVSTATYDSISKSVSAQDNSARHVWFKDDGTKMFVLGNQNTKL